MILFNLFYVFIFFILLTYGFSKNDFVLECYVKAAVYDSNVIKFIKNTINLHTLENYLLKNL